MDTEFRIKTKKHNTRADFAKRLDKWKSEVDKSWITAASAKKDLVPDLTFETATIFIKNSNVGLAWAIRSIPISYLACKCLDIDVKDVSSNDPFLEPYQVQHALGLIPISQSIPMNATFTLHFEAKPSDSVFATEIATSNHMTSSPNYNEFLPRDFPITKLFATRTIRASNIRVKLGYGYENAKFVVCPDVDYEIIDYVMVRKINKKGFLVPKTVYWKELVDNMKDATFNIEKPEQITQEWLLKIRNRVVIDPHGATCSLVPDVTKIAPVVVKKNLTYYRSTAYNPRDFYIKFRTSGNIPIGDLIANIRNAISGKLTRLIEALTTSNQSQSYITLTRVGEATHLLIRGEDQVFANMLVCMIYDMKPNIGFVNFEHEHRGNMTIIINIVDQEPVATIIAACKKLIDVIAKFTV